MDHGRTICGPLTGMEHTRSRPLEDYNCNISIYNFGIFLKSVFHHFLVCEARHFTFMLYD
jgi:hypothetical protein